MSAASRRLLLQGLAGAAMGIACGRDERRGPAAKTIQASRPASSDSPAASATAPKQPVETPIAQRRLGRTGVNVAMLGLGGYHIGKGSSDAESVALIRHAIELGITFLDNCWDYHDGKSEERYGKALRDGYRQRAFLMTKVDGRTAAAATEQLEQSLRRLQTDVIDLVQIHEIIRDSDPKRCFQDDGVVAGLERARKAGKLRFIGFTGHKDPKIHLAMLAEADARGFVFDAVQMPLNVLDAHYRSFEREVLPVLVAKDIGVLGMKSLAAGNVLKSGVVTAEECLRYALSLKTSVVISGMDSPEIVAKNAAIARNFQPLSAAERDDILARTKKVAADGKLEAFKTSREHDGTTKNPHWLETARL